MPQAQRDSSDRSIAIYCRVSTDEQAREGVSLDEQQERLQAYCKAMRWTEKVQLFIDDGYSAKSIERPQLTKLLKSIQDGGISKVMVTKLDRMSRRLLDLLQLIDTFQVHDVAFISISESFDTNTPSGRLTLQVLGAVAEFERERIRERVIDNMLHAAGQGKWLTQSPYGYRLEDKSLVIHEPEALIVRQVYDLFLHQGWGYYAIAKHLNTAGIPSRHHKEWSVRSIKLMLTNPAYKGTLVWNRTDSSRDTRKLKDEKDWITVEHCLPVIIGEETWTQVQNRLNKPAMASRAQSSPHLLGGFMKCGACGSGMSIGWSGSSNLRYRVYRCSANKNKGTCTSKQYRADRVEAWFLQGLSLLASSFGETLTLPYVKRLALSSTPNHQPTEQKIHTARNRYKRKVEAYTAGLIEIEDLHEERTRMESILELAEQQRRGDPGDLSVDELNALLQSQIRTVLDVIDALPMEETRALLGTLIQKVTIYGDQEIEIELHFHEDQD